MHVLVCVASRHDATAEIGEAIARQLAHGGLAVSFRPPDDVSSLDGVDAVVLGSALYTGHWLEPAVRFAERHADELQSRPVWLFSSGPVGDPRRPLGRRVMGPCTLPIVNGICTVGGAVAGSVTQGFLTSIARAFASATSDWP